MNSTASRRFRLLAITALCTSLGVSAYRHMKHKYLNYQIHQELEYGGDDPTTVRGLLDDGADIEARDYSGETPLLAAISYRHWPVVSLLLERGANANAVDNYGQTPLAAAAGAGQVEIVRALLARGANVHARDESGRTPIARALESSKETHDSYSDNQLHHDYPSTIALLTSAQGRQGIEATKP